MESDPHPVLTAGIRELLEGFDVDCFKNREPRAAPTDGQSVASMPAFLTDYPRP